MERAGYINGILCRSGHLLRGEDMTVRKPIRHTARATDTWTRRTPRTTDT
jgi:hypothetical protein